MEWSGERQEGYATHPLGHFLRAVSQCPSAKPVWKDILSQAYGCLDVAYQMRKSVIGKLTSEKYINTVLLMTCNQLIQTHTDVNTHDMNMNNHVI